MRLLHTKKLELQEFGGRGVPDYAILSHTWGSEEVTLQDIKLNKSMKSEGYEKVIKACSLAAVNGFDYIWIDTCCIDKTSSAELSEAINSMYRWYQEAVECYAYLTDVPHNSINRDTSVTRSKFRNSRWFTRGWTLQELIAPLSVIFLDNEWQEIGTKSNLQRDISEITGIPGNFLLGDELRHASIAQRMSWASKRETTRIEDLAYCLMGLFGIYMPMLYGEGERAFIRLQEEIMRLSDDHSLFAWRSIEDYGGILANSPAAFAHSGNIIPVSSVYATSSPSTLSSRGIHLSLRLINNGQQGQVLAILHCTEIGKERMRFALHLRDVFRTNEDFVREQSTTLKLIDMENNDPSQHSLTSLYVRQWHPTRNRKWEDMEKCVIKLVGVDGEDVTSRVVNLDSNCELSDGLIFISIAAIPDRILGRLLFVCKDGNFFEILLKKYGRYISADISTSLESDLQNVQDATEPVKEQNNQDRIVKVLDSGEHVHVAIQKRVLLLRGRRCLIGVVEISYSKAVAGLWLEHIAILEKSTSQKTLLSYAALRGLSTVVEHLLDRHGTESKSEDDSRTPLSRAAEGGQETTVKLLLEKGAELESKDKNNGTPLWWAAKNGHYGIIELLLEKGADVEAKDNEGQTPLWWAAKNGHEALLALLLEEGANVEAKDNEGQTPLWWAAKNGHEAVVELLLKKGADVKLNDVGEQTRLCRAAKNGQVTLMWLLLEIGVDVNLRDSCGCTPLWWAAKNRQEAAVQLLLENGADVNLKDKGVPTPLYWAAKYGDEGIVQLLIEKDADVEAKDSKYDQTPLLWAAENGHEGVVRLLLERGVNIEAKDGKYNQTALLWATENGHKGIVRLLLKKGVNIEAKDSEHNLTPLLWAAFKGHEGIIRLLLEEGANIEAKSGKDNLTPLLCTAENGHEDIIRLLLEKGANIEAKSGKDNLTPLLCAIKEGHKDIIQVLLEKGANIEAKDSRYNQTPLLWAAKKGHKDIVRLLLERGANIEAKDSKCNQMPLLWAAENGHEGVVQLLLATGRVNVEAEDNKISSDAITVGY